MRAQVTLTVNEAKRIIAKGVAGLPEVQKALESGKIFLKAGTTASAVCEELIGRPLRLSGRIVPEGTKAPKNFSLEFHCVLIENGQPSDPGNAMEELIGKMRPNDVCIFGANAIDVYGNAALMYGAPFQGNPGRVIPGLIPEITNIIIPVGLEKLIPGSITEMVSRTGRRTVDLSLGMPVGLLPIAGKIITEKDALPLLAGVSCLVIGRGGIFGAEGSTTMIVDGPQEEVEKAVDIIMSIKGAGVSGVEESLPACQAPSP
ncbi:MAG: hypothetical protein V1742_05020, partial [Pseudomonadota bacterium]